MIRLLLGLVALLGLALAPVSPATAMAPGDCVSARHAMADHQTPGHVPAAKPECCAALAAAVTPPAARLDAPEVIAVRAIPAPGQRFAGIDPVSEDPPPRAG